MYLLYFLQIFVELDELDQEKNFLHLIVTFDCKYL